MATVPEECCRVCGGASVFAFRQRLLGREVNYFDCPNCGYVQTEAPYWLEQAYASAINDVDTGIMKRNQQNARRVVLTLLTLGRLSGSVLDYAGGYGILVRLLRDQGVDARWSDKYCANLLARGFEADNRATTTYDLLTAFEALEHFEMPLDELSAMLRRSPTLLLSTELLPDTSNIDRQWWYFGQEHGQHIGFFRARTLALMGDKLGCHVATDGRSLHIFSSRRIPWSWLAAQRFQRMAPLVARIGLRSRTLEDFEQLRNEC